MKRSVINALIREAKAFLAECGFALPPFAQWTPEDWRNKGHECDEIRRNMLGWDITDFGRGEYEKLGLLLFTLRNGNWRVPRPQKPYCEKILINHDGQRCPMHFHWQKTEDIIHRAGAPAVMRLFNAGDNDEPDQDAPVRVSMDGVVHQFKPGERVVLNAGESITLGPRLYHEFWAEGGTCLLGEVSAVNDDEADNRFAEPIGRFPQIEEDQPPLHYLCNEYPAPTG